MKITIEGSTKEIGDLVLAMQDRKDEEVPVIKTSELLGHEVKADSFTPIVMGYKTDGRLNRELEKQCKEMQL